jgi:hypothetical protein
MEARDIIRPILAGLVGIGLVVLVIVLIVKAVSGPTSAPTSQTNLTNYATTPNVNVSVLIDAPTNIDQDHRQVKITVGPTQNEIDIIQGYQGTVINRMTYPNNTAAFSTFLQTLKLLNFSKGRVGTTNYSGYCPTGERYVYSLYNGTNNVFNYWSTSCGGQGTFQGNASAVLLQFSLQIPSTDFEQLTGSISLGF